jgi:hypothetical protein
MKLLASIVERRDALPFMLRLGALALIAVVSLAPLWREPGRAGAQEAGGQIRWKWIEMAQVRLDDKAPLKWNVYQPDKKGSKDKKRDASLVLVLLGHRYLMIDTKARLVYLVPLAELHASGQDFDSSDLAQENEVIPSTDWTQRDVGPAELYRFTLGDYGRVLEVSLPHMPDLRAFY